jgi:hypothetical protein
MYTDHNWIPVTGPELSGFIAHVNPIDGKYQASETTTNVSWRALPFYDQVVLVRLTDPTWTPRHLVLYYLVDAGNPYRLNGQSWPIHEINAKAPIKITDANVLEYLKFFCFFVRGEEGPFLIAEHIDDPYMPKNMDMQTKTVIEGTLRDASYEGKDASGNFMCDSVVFYSNALFIANFQVQPNADLPTRVDAPIGEVRPPKAAG